MSRRAVETISRHANDWRRRRQALTRHTLFVRARPERPVQALRCVYHTPNGLHQGETGANGMIVNEQ